jgi:hypothetical protein
MGIQHTYFLLSADNITCFANSSMDLTVVCILSTTKKHENVIPVSAYSI